MENLNTRIYWGWLFFVVVVVTGEQTFSAHKTNEKNEEKKGKIVRRSRGRKHVCAAKQHPSNKETSELNNKKKKRAKAKGFHKGKRRALLFAADFGDA